MKIKEITRLVSFGNHENISLCAEIGYGETVEECSAELLHQIKVLIAGDEKMVRTLNSHDYYERRVDELRDNVTALEKQKQKVEEWLSKFNIPADAFNRSDIPF